MEDKTLRLWIQRVLFSGVTASGLLMAVGLAMVILQGPAAGTELIRTGMIVLIATPIIRVVIIAVQCGVNKDWRFLGVSAGVLGLLGFGIWLGF